MHDLFQVQELLVAPRGRTILRVPMLSIPEQGHTAIIGPNGAGKSTLLRALLGLLGGQIMAMGKPITAAVKQRQLAWVGQHGHFNMPLTVTEYVQLGHVSPQQAWFQQANKLPEKVAALLETFDLAPLAGQRIGQLSGGEQQRASIVRALLQEAPILLLDEPFNHLDIRHQHRLMHYVHEHRQQFSAVMVLHDLAMAANHADYVVLLNQGEVVAAGSPEEVMTAERLSEIYQWPIRRVAENGAVYFRMHAVA